MTQHHIPDESSLQQQRCDSTTPCAENIKFDKKKKYTQNFSLAMSCITAQYKQNDGYVVLSCFAEGREERNLCFKGW
jgi:hypothetical protein